MQRRCCMRCRCILRLHRWRLIFCFNWQTADILMGLSHMSIVVLVQLSALQLCAFCSRSCYQIWFNNNFPATYFVNVAWFDAKYPVGYIWYDMRLRFACDISAIKISLYLFALQHSTFNMSCVASEEMFNSTQCFETLQSIATVWPSWKWQGSVTEWYVGWWCATVGWRLWRGARCFDSWQGVLCDLNSHVLTGVSWRQKFAAFVEDYNHRLLGSCSRKAGLDNITYRYTYYKIRKIHNNNHTTEDVCNVICVDQVSYWQFRHTYT